MIKLFFMTLCSLSLVLGQSAETKVALYESSKLDKADALALSLFCPGAGLFYAGKNAQAVASFGVNFYLAYSFFSSNDEGDTDASKTFAILMSIARAIDIGWALMAVDDYNRKLRVSIGLVARMTPTGSRPFAQLVITF